MRKKRIHAKFVLIKHYNKEVKAILRNKKDGEKLICN